MRSQGITLRRPIFAVALATAVACAAPQNSDDGAMQDAEPVAAEVIEVAPPPMADPADVASVDAIVRAVYDVISGDAGEERDWDRFRSLFVPDARLMPVSTEEGENGRRTNSINEMSPAQFAERTNQFFAAEGFYEVETGNVTETYGDIAHRFSSYASFRTEEDTEPFDGGINSFQLMNDGERWWILTIFWQGEAAAGPIPDRYLDNP